MVAFRMQRWGSQGKPNFLDDGCMQELKSDGMNGNNNKSFSLKGAFPNEKF